MQLYFFKMDGVPSKSDYAHHLHWTECVSFELFNSQSQVRSKSHIRSSSSVEEMQMEVVLSDGMTPSRTLRKMYEEARNFKSAVFEVGKKNGNANFTLIQRVRITVGDVISFYSGGALPFGKISFKLMGSFTLEFGSATQLVPEWKNWQYR